MGNGQVARRYAIAWLAASKDKGIIPAAASDADSLLSMLKNSPEFRTFVASPLISQGEQASAMVAIAKKASLNAGTADFLSVLIDNRRLAMLGPVLESFKGLLAAESGEVQASVTSATQLDAQKITDISTQIASKLGKNVSLETKIDPSLIGGLVIRVGSTMIDDSIKAKLDRLSRHLQTESAA